MIIVTVVDVVCARSAGINEELMTEVDKVLQAAAAATGGLLMGADGAYC